jgi:hypothetical protein
MKKVSKGVSSIAVVYLSVLTTALLLIQKIITGKSTDFVKELIQDKKGIELVQVVLYLIIALILAIGVFVLVEVVFGKAKSDVNTALQSLTFS